MRPSHPCPMCGHEFADECRRLAEQVPARARGTCPHCRDRCLVVRSELPPPEAPQREPPSLRVAP